MENNRLKNMRLCKKRRIRHVLGAFLTCETQLALATTAVAICAASVCSTETEHHSTPDGPTADQESGATTAQEKGRIVTK